MCIHSGVLLNNRPIRAGVNKINSEALTRNLSLFFSQKSSIICMFKEQQSASRMRRKHVVKHIFHCFPSSPYFGLRYILHIFPALPFRVWQALVSPLKSTQEVSLCHILTASFSLTLEERLDPNLTAISSAKSIFAFCGRGTPPPPPQKKAKSIMHPDIFCRIAY